jgi:hypothetical protein
MNALKLRTSTRSTKLPIVLGTLILFSATNIFGQSNEAPSAATNQKDGKIPTHLSGYGPGIEILSDTQGVDFAPYLKQILPSIRNAWINLLPEESRPPVNAQSETVIRFKISPDGKILAMHLEGGSLHQMKSDRAAWGAIVSISSFVSPSE